MIVTDKPYPQKFKACLSKKGGMGVGVIGAHRSLRPGASGASDTRARALCCIFTTILYVVGGRHKKRANYRKIIRPFSHQHKDIIVPNLCV